MPRSRADIEAEIAALQAELATVQPETVRFTSYGLKKVTLSKSKSNFGAPHFDIVSTVGSRERLEFNLSPRDARLAADWLNYHFPKENA